jgi:hypothetical protein
VQVQRQPLALVDDQPQQIKLGLAADAQVLDVFHQGVDVLIGELHEGGHGRAGDAAPERAGQIVAGRLGAVAGRGVLEDPAAEVARIGTQKRGVRPRPAAADAVTGDAVLAVQAPRIPLGVVAQRTGGPLQECRIEVDSLGHLRIVGRAEKRGKGLGERRFLGSRNLGRIPAFDVQLELRRVIQPAAQEQGQERKKQPSGGRSGPELTPAHEFCHTRSDPGQWNGHTSKGSGNAHDSDIVARKTGNHESPKGRKAENRQNPSIPPQAFR